MIGILITQIDLDIVLICLGRLIQGISSGFFSASSTRFIEETLPTKLYDTLGPIFTVSWAFGVLLAYIIAEILPKDSEEDELRNTELWRVIYCYFPMFFFLLLTFSLVFYIKHDPPKFLIN